MVAFVVLLRKEGTVRVNYANIPQTIVKLEKEREYGYPQTERGRAHSCA